MKNRAFNSDSFILAFQLNQRPGEDSALPLNTVFYLSQTAAPEGVFVAPFVRYQSITIEDSDLDESGKLSGFGGGLIIGKQWVFKDKITLEAFIGPAYYSGSVKDNNNADLDTGSFDGFGVRTGVTFGFKF